MCILHCFFNHIDLRKIITYIQAFLIVLWTAFCGLLGLLLLLLTWNQIWVMKIMSHYIWSTVICFVSGVRVKATGLENIDRRGSYIYVANHSSLFDIVAVCRASNVPMFYIAKKELKKIPIMGHFMTAVGMIFVDRKDRESAMKSMRMAGEKIRGGKNVIAFPEGTRSKDGNVQVFKRGSFVIAKESRVGVSPIAIKNAINILRSGSSDLRSGTILVHFEKPIQPETFASKSEEEIANICRDIIVNRISQM
jgi:1-acyl-sn-glycerol-3-phosphate acyltransferase